MKVQKQAVSESKSPTEKERLELVEKRVEIQRKRLEIRKEKLNMDEIIAKRSISLEEQNILLHKISELRCVLGDWTIDEERTILASEPFIAPIIVGERREIVLKKLLELIKRV